jgi:hypothetical protein
MPAHLQTHAHTHLLTLPHILAISPTCSLTRILAVSPTCSLAHLSTHSPHPVTHPPTCSCTCSVTGSKVKFYLQFLTYSFVCWHSVKPQCLPQWEDRLQPQSIYSCIKSYLNPNSVIYWRFSRLTYLTKTAQWLILTRHRTHVGTVFFLMLDGVILCLMFFLWRSTSDSTNVNLSQLQKWYVSVRCLMWHILCHVVFMHLSGAMMCIPSFWMIRIYAMFRGSGKVMLTSDRLVWWGGSEKCLSAAG